jgi:hypothetical protein
MVLLQFALCGVFLQTVTPDFKLAVALAALTVLPIAQVIRYLYEKQPMLGAGVLFTSFMMAFITVPIALNMCNAEEELMWTKTIPFFALLEVFFVQPIVALIRSNISR